jgi:hypothetical protein
MPFVRNCKQIHRQVRVVEVIFIKCRYLVVYLVLDPFTTCYTTNALVHRATKIHFYWYARPQGVLASANWYPSPKHQLYSALLSCCLLLVFWPPRIIATTAAEIKMNPPIVTSQVRLHTTYTLKCPNLHHRS